MLCCFLVGLMTCTRLNKTYIIIKFSFNFYWLILWFSYIPLVISAIYSRMRSHSFLNSLTQHIFINSYYISCISQLFGFKNIKET